MPGAWVFRLTAQAALLAGSLGAAAAVAAVPMAKVDFRLETASAEVRQVATWALQSGDSGGFPYLIVDKVNARVFVFDAGGHLQGDDAALLGMARGDDIEAGIGDRKLSAIAPTQRITPAGRFMASIDHDLHGGEILLIDYAASIALHPVVKGVPAKVVTTPVAPEPADAALTE